MSKKNWDFYFGFFGWRTELVFLIFDFCFTFSAILRAIWQKRAPNSSPNQKSLKHKFCSTFKIGPKLLCFAVLRLKKLLAFFDLRLKSCLRVAWVFRKSRLKASKKKLPTKKNVQLFVPYSYVSFRKSVLSFLFIEICLLR